MKHKTHPKSYAILSTFDCYPSTRKATLWLILMFLVGIFLGMVVTMILTRLVSQEFATSYGMLISYPLQFVPAMMYASAVSQVVGMRRGGIAAGLTVERRGNDVTMGQRGAMTPGNFPVDRHGTLSMSWCAVCVMAVMATIACAIIVEPIVALLPPMPEFLEEAMKGLVDGPVWVALLSVAVFAPFFEEWLCRGMVMRSILMRGSVTKAIVLSALFFAVIHMNPWQAIPAFILGSLFGFVYYKTGSLRLTMLMHCANNALSVALMKLPVTRDYEYMWQMMGFSENWLPYCVTYAAALILLFSTIFIFARIEKRDF